MNKFRENFFEPYDTPDYTEGGWLRWALSGELPLDIAASMLRVVLGFAIGAGLAIDAAMNRLNNHLLRWHRGLEH